ncbi:zinc-ribbon domain-containing protein [Paenibacillus cremeus]|uniref:Zinc-ribbon domain-containing protein n=1 Tax=Paenibacillus cremeus TaxID=2163881 RepID=A0A559KCT8_9BACL|nr:zinc-ribbon domain-containing protein [Paenibacillus cremeus]TVY09940.1 hypothetical protein FPZ49_11250 [Paenibacillus cremeus]
MAIITDIYKDGSYWVETSLASKMIRYYEELGYVIPRKPNYEGKLIVPKGTKILVRIEHLLKSSNERVIKICDCCNKRILNQKYQNIIRHRKIDGLDRCVDCGKLKSGESNRTNAPYNKSLDYLFPNIAKEWHSTMNGAQKPKSTYAQSQQKAWFLCSNCGLPFELKVQIRTLYNVGCPFCSDSISYPEKFITSLLRQLNVQFEKEKIFKWSSGKRYDFYFKVNQVDVLLETHGLQHYEKGFANVGGRTLEQEIENDKMKKRLAEENEINKYIVIDCRYSDFNFIKNSLINSELAILFDLTDVDWNVCNEFSMKSIIKTTCELWNNGKTAKQIEKELLLNKSTVIRYLKYGHELRWCAYDPQKLKNQPKPVVQLNLDGTYINKYSSSVEAARQTNIHHQSIRDVCIGKYKHSGGYIWMYKDDYENEKDKIKTPEKIHITKSIVRLTLNGEYIDEFESQSKAARELNLQQSSRISNVCNGKGKSAHGYKWMFKNDYEKLKS